MIYKQTKNPTIMKNTRNQIIVIRATNVKLGETRYYSSTTDLLNDEYVWNCSVERKQRSSRIYNALSLKTAYDVVRGWKLQYIRIDVEKELAK